MIHITDRCNTYSKIKLLPFCSTFVESFSGLARDFVCSYVFPTVVPGEKGICHWTTESNARAFRQPEVRGDGNYCSAAGTQMLNLLELFFSNMEMCLLRHVYGPEYGLFLRSLHVLERNVYVVWWGGLYSSCFIVLSFCCY